MIENVLKLINQFSVILHFSWLAFYIYLKVEGYSESFKRRLTKKKKKNIISNLILLVAS